MPKMRGLLKSRPKIDEEELALAQSRTEARLADLFGTGEAAGAEASAGTGEPVAGGDAATGAEEADEIGEEAAAVVSPGPWPGGPRPPIIVEGETDVILVELDPQTGELVGVMARPGDEVGTNGWDLRDVTQGTTQLTIESDLPPAVEAVLAAATPSAPAAEPAAVVEAVPETAVEPEELAAVALDAPTAVDGPVALDAPTAVDGPVTLDSPVAAAALLPAVEVPEVPAPPAPVRRPSAAPPARPSAARRTHPARTTKTKSRSAPPPAVSCPYCALLLQPPPASSRRCPRCRQRIVVKRVDGRAVLLTEASVLVFNAERERIATSVRLGRERERWLRLAATAGAPAQRRERLAAAALTAETVASSRALYLGTVDRAVKVARRDRDWETAARIRRDQALALHRVAGSPLPPPGELVALLREGAAAELRGISDISREAELVSARCCPACTADDGRIFRIATELRTPRLPHVGCPRGLCRCAWDLAARDRSTMRRYLRRRPRMESSAAPGDPVSAT
jgi:hypothetical protein